MSTDTDKINTGGKGGPLSLDMWAVIIAFLLALAVKFDIFKNIPW
jgi:hypothetical protein